MKTNRINIVSIIVLLSSFALITCDTDNNFDTPYEDYFVKYYGGDGEQTGVDMVVNTDGTIVMVGNSQIGTTSRIFFIRVDSRGITLAQNLIGGTTEEVRDIEPTPDGNYIVLSNFEKAAGNKESKLIKVTPDGVKLDSVMFGTMGNDISNSVTSLQKVSDYLVAGTSDYTSTWGDPNATNPDLGDFKAYRFDSNLDSVSTWFFNAGFGGNYDVATKLFELPSGFLCFGSTTANNPNNKRDFYYFAVTEDGSGGEIKSFGSLNGNNSDVYSATKDAPSNPGYLAIGSNSNGTAGQSSIFISKVKDPPLNYTDADKGLHQASLPVGAQSLSGICIIPSSPQGYLVAGNDLGASGTTNIWLSRLDIQGNVKWSASFGSDRGTDTAGAIAELPDGKILLLGTMELEANLTRMVLIKLNSQGKLLK